MCSVEKTYDLEFDLYITKIHNFEVFFMSVCSSVISLTYKCTVLLLQVLIVKSTMFLTD